jgi:exoribonuclease R
VITADEIFRYISKQPRHIAGYKQILHDLGIRGKDRRPVEQLLRDLTRQKKLVAIGKERWGLPTSASSQDLVVGRLRMHRDGYGFVTPEPESLPPRARGKLLGDVFIPPPEIGNAMHGDQVLVELGRIRPDGKGEGRILRVTEREQERVVGIFHYGSRHNYVKPFDEKIGMEIIIPPGMEYPRAEDEEGHEVGESDRAAHARVAQPPSAVHGLKREAISSDQSGRTHQRRVAQALLPVHQKAHQQQSQSSSASPRPGSPGSPHLASRGGGLRGETPHRVLGKEAQKRTYDDLENVFVEVEIIQFPSATHEPRGRVVEILGYEDDFGVDVEIMIRKHHIRHVFPPAVLEEAQEITPVIHQQEIARRHDFRNLPIVTIDGETARDFDDAVLVRRLPGGHYELQVHIADVAQYVEDGSAIDEEARKRGTSVYFPDRAVPMLPLELSTDICSLRPNLDRLVLSCIMELDRQGEIVSYDLAEGVIRSAHRMTYTDVNAIIEGDTLLRGKYSDMVVDFELMYELAQVLNRKRAKRGSIDFDLPEPVIEFDEHGLMKSVTPSERNWAHRLIEEFMLAANETVATHLEQRHIASLYRIHEKPDPKRIFEFEQIAASFGYSLGVGALPIKRVTTRADKRSHYGSGRRAPVIELPEEVHITPRMYQKLVSKIIGKAEERVLSYLMLRSLKQARYSEVNEGHFALAAPTYTHFTSPIRRYPDLIVHRILKDVLRDDEIAKGRQAGVAQPRGPHQARFSPDGVEVSSAVGKKLRKESSGEEAHRLEQDHVAQALLPVHGRRHKGAGYEEDVATEESRVAQLRGPQQARFSPGGVEAPWAVEDFGKHAQHLPFSFSPLEHSPWSKRKPGHGEKPPQKGFSASPRPGSPGSPHLASRGGGLRGEKFVPGLPLETLHDIADSSSQSERAADEAERELMEWKKLKFMESRLGEDFDGLIVNVMKYGFFVELTELFIEGLVPIDTLEDDHFTYRENTRQIIGQRSGKIFSIGDRVRVLADRIDHVQRKIQFALVQEKPKPSRAQKRHKKSRR